MAIVSEYKVVFHPGSFFKFFAYHMLFYTLGPLAVALIIIIDSLNLTRNMMFTASLPFMIPQYFQFLSFSSMIVLYAFMDLRNIYWEELALMVAQIIIRSFIVAVRYAYVSRYRLRLLQTQQVTGDVLDQDLLLHQWIKLNSYSVKSELDGALYRNNVEESLFKVELLEMVPDDLKDFYVTVGKRTSVGEAQASFVRLR